MMDVMSARVPCHVSSACSHLVAARVHARVCSSAHKFQGRCVWLIPAGSTLRRHSFGDLHQKGHSSLRRRDGVASLLCQSWMARREPWTGGFWRSCHAKQEWSPIFSNLRGFEDLPTNAVASTRKDSFGKTGDGIEEFVEGQVVTTPRNQEEQHQQQQLALYSSAARQVLGCIRIVLVEPQGPLNIGMVCRAMANFGLSDLVLVNPGPDIFGTDAEAARMMACNAQDILSSARIVPSLPAALNRVSRVVATTGRFRAPPCPPLEVLNYPSMQLTSPGSTKAARTAEEAARGKVSELILERKCAKVDSEGSPESAGGDIYAGAMAWLLENIIDEVVSAESPSPQMHGPAPTGSALLPRQQPRQHQVSAIVFGREDNGLTNQEMTFAQRTIAIATDPDCPSCNLSHAVALVGQEVSRTVHEMIEGKRVPTASCVAAGNEREAELGEKRDNSSNIMEKEALVDMEISISERSRSFGREQEAAIVEARESSSMEKKSKTLQDRASVEELEAFLQHAESVLLDVKFLLPHTAEKKMAKLRRILMRSEPSQNEMALLYALASKSKRFVEHSGTTHE